MANFERTENDPLGVFLEEGKYQDETLDSVGAATWKAGMILGRVTVGGNLRPYDSGAADGSQIPVAVLRQEVVWAGAGTASARVCISGVVRVSGAKGLHVYNGGTPLAPTAAERDQLRDYGIIGRDVLDTSVLDN